MNNIGWYHMRLGDHAQAVTYGERAVEIQRGIEYLAGQADALDTVGVAYQRLGNHARAIECCAEAMEISQRLGDLPGTAECLLHLGESQHAAGDPAAARASYTACLALLEEAGHPDADLARQRLRELDGG